MNLFKPTTFTWGQLYEFKWAIFLIGIAVGAEWPGIFSPYALVIFILGLILAIPPTIAWFREH
ncbi:MAG: hypothetical protein ACREGR_03750 [Minisyncoccia bacterium]